MFCSVTKNVNSTFELLIQKLFFCFSHICSLSDQLPCALCLVYPRGKFDNAEGKFWKFSRNVTTEFLKYFEKIIDFVEAFKIC